MQESLKNAEVWRGGVTSPNISQEKDPIWSRVDLWTGGANAEDIRRGLKINTAITSKGGGRTSVSIWVPSSDFVAVVRAMKAADPIATKAAMEAVFPRVDAALSA